jgi:hypothetical protein
MPNRQRVFRAVFGVEMRYWLLCDVTFPELSIDETWQFLRPESPDKSHTPRRRF